MAKETDCAKFDRIVHAVDEHGKYDESCVGNLVDNDGFLRRHLTTCSGDHVNTKAISNPCDVYDLVTAFTFIFEDIPDEQALGFHVFLLQHRTYCRGRHYYSPDTDEDECDRFDRLIRSAPMYELLDGDQEDFLRVHIHTCKGQHVEPLLIDDRCDRCDVSSILAFSPIVPPETQGLLFKLVYPHLEACQVPRHVLQKVHEEERGKEAIDLFDTITERIHRKDHELLNSANTAELIRRAEWLDNIEE